MSIAIGEDAFDQLPQTLRMRQDLSDPARRITLREEYKQGLPKFYPDIRAELHLTVQQEDRLFDLLADFQMQHLDLFYAKPSGAPLEKASRFQDHRDAATKPSSLSWAAKDTTSIGVMGRNCRNVKPSPTLSPGWIQPTH